MIRRTCPEHPDYEGRLGFPQPTIEHLLGCPVCWDIHTDYVFGRDIPFAARVNRAPADPARPPTPQPYLRSRSTR